MKIIVLLISFCLIGLLEGPAIADSCRGFDLNAGPNSPFKEIPVYDQDGAGICYAYTSSQMIDYYRIKNGDKKYGLTNPIYASWATYYKSPSLFKSTSLHGGRVTEVVESLQELGVCSEEEVNQKLSFLKKEANLTDAQLLFYLETLYKQYNESRSKNSNFVNLKSKKSDLLDCDKADDLKSSLQKSRLFGIAPTLVLEKIFKGCKSKKVTVPELDYFNFGSDEKMKAVIHSSLKKKLPVEINICTGFFSNSSYRGLVKLAPFTRSSSDNLKSDCRLHSVLVTGQARIGGKCHFQIRNSWGSFWYPSQATSCACITRDGKYKAQCKRGEGAEYVGCWFEDKTVLPNVGDVIVFK